jgi:hypothetical protein
MRTRRGFPHPPFIQTELNYVTLLSGSFNPLEARGGGS